MTTLITPNDHALVKEFSELLENHEIQEALDRLDEMDEDPNIEPLVYNACHDLLTRHIEEEKFWNHEYYITDRNKHK